MPLLGNQEPLETKCGDCGLGRSFLACLRMTHPFVLSLVTFSARQLAAPDLLRTCHLSPSGCLLSVPVASSAQLAVCPLSLPTASSRPPPPPQEVTGASSRGGGRVTGVGKGGRLQVPLLQWQGLRLASLFPGSGHLWGFPLGCLAFCKRQSCAGAAGSIAIVQRL